MGCCDTPGLMPIPTAITTLLENTTPLTQTEVVSLVDAQNRITAEDIRSPLNVPPFANSAMDGYALRIADLAESNTLKLAGRSFAGVPFEGKWPKGSCIRIMTGAEVPEGADAVIMQEQAIAEGDNITFTASAKPQQNIRPIGDDVKAGDVVIPKGTLLTPREVPMLATLGIATVTVMRKPKVAFFSTGDELRQVGEPLGKGEIYDSNRYTIRALLEKLHCEAIDLGVIPDCPEKLRDAFLKAADLADVIITSGGVSVGEADYTKDILAQEGEVGFWKIAIKPGKPFAFGKVKNALFCGLPGNPVSVLVTLHVLVQPLLAKLAGHSRWQPAITLKAKAETRFKKVPGRTDYQRAIYRTNENGELVVASTGNQGSGAFSSLSIANCFAVLEQERGHIDVGETVTIEPFSAILN
ncbi:molybdopterin molybdotransferase [Grimontia hollisae]|nr:molybdopterin molybdotransferase MoeA [Grimontia hollisae]AMG32037.1 molybdopterin molybdotransferase [Grimontia hollisae]MDF2184317.1 molybdopterin molybdotransferase MoeA [Grimontia hollisae]STO44078.1 Molybdopterin molybdenumtransferase [Grimontia hollisae]STO57225.1 Molybdopterin molybdenumtransferase [Grimontia hollisae]STQ75092.1 Molybdopterin molybdenumtransferase [Grimontia hollisae]